MGKAGVNGFAFAESFLSVTPGVFVESEVVTDEEELESDGMLLLPFDVLAGVAVGPVGTLPALVVPVDGDGAAFALANLRLNNSFTLVPPVAPPALCNLFAVLPTGTNCGKMTELVAYP